MMPPMMCVCLNCRRCAAAAGFIRPFRPSPVAAAAGVLSSPFPSTHTPADAQSTVPSCIPRVGFGLLLTAIKSSCSATSHPPLAPSTTLARRCPPPPQPAEPARLRPQDFFLTDSVCGSGTYNASQPPAPSIIIIFLANTVRTVVQPPPYLVRKESREGLWAYLAASLTGMRARPGFYISHLFDQLM